MENRFEELREINTKSWEFRKRYIKHAFRYFFTYFFFAAPFNKWYDCFGSTHRVSYDLVRAQMAIENQKDCFNQNALRNRFLKWGEKNCRGLTN